MLEPEADLEMQQPMWLSDANAGAKKTHSLEKGAEILIEDHKLDVGHQFICGNN